MKYRDGWKQLKVGDLGNVVTGKTPRTSITDNYGDDILFLTPSDDLSVKNIYDTRKKLSLKGLMEVKNCLLPTNSICVSCIGSDLGKVVKTTRPTVTNQQINTIIPYEEVDADFVYYTMLMLGKELNFISKTSTAVPIVNKSSFSNYDILIPEKKEEQRRIAAVLSVLDDKIELNNQINKNLEEQAQAAFIKWIIEDNANEPLGSLLDIADINPTRILKRGDKAIYVEMANLPTQGSFPVDWEIKEFAGGMKFRNGDTLMARITPCLENGKRAYINFLDDGDVAFGSTEYIVITSREGYCKEIFYFLTRYTDFVNYAVLNMNGSSGRQRVSSDIVGQYILNIPTKESSRAFEQIAAPIMRLIKINSIENQKLAAIRDSLLPKLMSGEIKVV